MNNLTVMIILIIIDTWVCASSFTRYQKNRETYNLFVSVLAFVAAISIGVKI